MDIDNNSNNLSDIYYSNDFFNLRNKKILKSHSRHNSENRNRNDNLIGNKDINNNIGNNIIINDNKNNNLIKENNVNNFTNINNKKTN